MTLDAGVLRLVRQFPDPVLLISQAGTILAYNGKAARLLGSEDLLAGGLLQALLSEPPTRLLSYLALCARTNDSSLGAFSLRSNPESRCRFEGSGMEVGKDGRSRAVWLRILPQEQANSRFLLLNERITGLAREVHARKRIELALRLRTAQFETLLNEAPLGIYFVDADLRVREMNPTARTRFGNPEIIGKRLDQVFYSIWPREYADHRLQQFRRTLATGESYIIPESIEERVDLGTRECYEWQVNRIPLPDGCFGLVCYFRDISVRKQAEEALRESEKLAAAGRLATSISHEINNPLEAVTNLLYLAKQDENMHSVTRQYLVEADAELSRMAHITKQTLGFYRDTTSPVLFEPTQLIESVLAIYDQKVNARKALVIKDFRATPLLRGFAGEFRQVISNLLINALDAMSTEGGLLTLRVRPSRKWDIEEQKGVRITVADNGSGIRPDRLQKIFDAFFTTKQDVGTGLGLWLSQEIVQKHRGSISVKSRVAPSPSGTAFSIFWPCPPESGAL